MLDTVVTIIGSASIAATTLLAQTTDVPTLLEPIIETGIIGVVAVLFFVLWMRERARLDETLARERDRLERLAGFQVDKPAQSEPPTDSSNDDTDA